MGITTKKGDKGLTQLCGGRKIRKDDIRVDACGTLDELCSFLGLAKSLIKNTNTKKLLESIQKDLFIICTEVATGLEFISKLKKRIDNNYVKRLEENINRLETKIKLKERCFLLPGENFISGVLDVARAIARNAERKIVTLKNKKILKNPRILIYLNRLSDLLYLLARAHEKRHRKLKL